MANRPNGLRTVQRLAFENAVSTLRSTDLPAEGKSRLVDQLNAYILALVYSVAYDGRASL